MWIPCVDCGSTKSALKMIQTGANVRRRRIHLRMTIKHTAQSNKMDLWMNETPWMNWLNSQTNHAFPSRIWRTHISDISDIDTSTSYSPPWYQIDDVLQSCQGKDDGIPGSNWATFQYPTLYLHPAPVAVSLSNSGGQTEHSFDTSRCRPKHLLRSCPPKHSLNHIYT